MKQTILLLVLVWIFAVGAFGVDGAAEPLVDIYDAQILDGIGSTSQGLDARATEYYQQGDYASAAEYYILHLRLNPQDETSLYNLACCYGLLGREDLASRVLMMAYKAGFEDVDHIRRDPDFAKVREAAEYVAAVDSIAVWAERKAKSEGKLEYYPIRTWLPYRIHLPEGYDPAKACDLLIGLHGYGDNAVAFGGINRALNGRQMIYVVPEAPYILPGSSGPGFSWTPLVDYQDSLQVFSYHELNAAIRELCLYLQDKYQIDKTYLMGFSQGCFMTYNIGLSNPDLFAGLIAFGGWLDQDIIGEKQLAEAKNVKVFIAHGTADQMVEYSSAVEALQLLTKKGFRARLYRFEDGHRVDRDALLEGLDWIQGD